MIKTNLRWGSQVSATDPFVEAPGSAVAAGFLLAYMVAWWPFMAACVAVYLMAAMVTGFLVVLSLPCLLWGRIRRRRARADRAPAP